MLCYCDRGEPAAIYHATRPIARIGHRCHECGRMIAPGERYERVSGLWEGEWAHFNTCLYCLAARDIVESRSCCFCWEHEGLWENIRDELEFGPERPGIKMAIGRIVVEAKIAAGEG